MWKKVRVKMENINLKLRGIDLNLNEKCVNNSIQWENQSMYLDKVRYLKYNATTPYHMNGNHDPP